MSAKRNRKRTRAGKPAGPAKLSRGEQRQVDVEERVDELLILLRVMPAAVARDSAGMFTSDRHAQGAVEGSAATVNVHVVDATRKLNGEIFEASIEAVRILSRSASVLRSTPRMVAAIPDWHRALEQRQQPLARHLYSDLKRWVSIARSAIGVQRPYRMLGHNCPDHRDTKPTPLVIEGAQAQLAASLLAGPPRARHLVVGPLCAAVRDVAEETERDCEHTTCRWIRERRFVDARGRATDWCLDPRGEFVWTSEDGDSAFTWRESNAIVCRHCKRAWTSTSERRMLLRELHELGDKRVSDLVGA